jgi:hypothetical protein
METPRDLERRFLATGADDLLAAYRSALVWRGIPLRRVNAETKRLRQQRRGKARKAKYTAL